MTSRSSSRSEGEILDTDLLEDKKATKPLPSKKDGNVDRKSRKYTSLSRTPSPTGSSYSRTSQRRDRRSRSRSPHRNSRGGKRRREEDDYSSRNDKRDGRRFKVHYEDRDEGSSHRSRDRERGSRYDDRRSDTPREKRLRTVSRSPPRFSNLSKDKHSGGKSLTEQSVSKQDSAPGATAMLQTDTENRQSGKSVSFHMATKQPADDTQSASDAMDTQPETEGLSEAELIEQRRKRREAIKAKYRNQSSLLVQVLDPSIAATPIGSDPSTPASMTDSIDSMNVIPGTPEELSAPASPAAFEIYGDADLANTHSQASPNSEAEPSAADYDPTQDMQDDRKREDHRANGQEVSAQAYEETKDKKKDVLVPDTTKTDVDADDFDMFADDADMFADAPTTKAPKKAVPVATAAIDMSMLDDYDDQDGYYKIIIGELLENRYHVQMNLGKGVFSNVVRATDQTNSKLVAIKVIRANDTMRKAALKEIDILGKLKAADPEDKKHLIRLERYFEHKGHLCMVFENLSINLREVLKKFGRDVGINLRAVRLYAQQMFLGLSLLRKCSIIHADLKPDNILVNESRNLLKICDLGSASDASENEITPYLVSRFYRAPEIVLGLPYDFAIDTWSVGCTLYELFTGKILFTGRNNNQMLRSIMECRGKFSHKLLRKAEFAPLHFDDLLNFRSVEQDKITGKDVVRMHTFSGKPNRDLRSRVLASGGDGGRGESEAKETALFIDLLDKCLALNPEKRITPTEALKHPFIFRQKQ